MASKSTTKGSVAHYYHPHKIAGRNYRRLLRTIKSHIANQFRGLPHQIYYLHFITFGLLTQKTSHISHARKFCFLFLLSIHLPTLTIVSIFPSYHMRVIPFKATPMPRNAQKTRSSCLEGCRTSQGVNTSDITVSGKKPVRSPPPDVGKEEKQALPP
jgi:hypothetical protein